MAIVRRTLDPANPPRLSREERARLDSKHCVELVTHFEAEAADEDNPPLTEAELARLRSVRLVQRTRRKTGLSQGQFARQFRINSARLRDWEQGRSTPDSAALAYLTVIEREPAAVRRALGLAGKSEGDSQSR
ncbi:MAG: helix-turn-helix domain-containing protein [Hyphomicrobiales bacterium]